MPHQNKSNEVRAKLNTARRAIERAQFTLANAEDPAKIAWAERRIPELNEEMRQLYEQLHALEPVVFRPEPNASVGVPSFPRRKSKF